MNEITRRAQRLDQMRLKGIEDSLTLEEATNIMSIWGSFLEYSGPIRFLFGLNIPESFLPYPIDIIQGALHKMEKHFHSKGDYARVNLLQETEMLLVSFTNDKEAIEKSIELFSKEKFQESYLLGLHDLQITQAEEGYLIDRKLWKLSKKRIIELQNPELTS